MKAVIIFHSVRGNCFIMAEEFQKALTNHDIKVEIYRVADNDLDKRQKKFDNAKIYYSDIVKIPIATPELLLDADLILLGSPTYFANMSAEMKAFIDSTAIYFADNLLWNKLFAGFTSASASEAGGMSCLKTMIDYAMNVGMIPISVPIPVQFKIGISPYGIVQISGANSDKRPNKQIIEGIILYSKTLSDKIKTMTKNSV
jgi:NAD(P)H dehydrogenase (quinone)